MLKKLKQVLSVFLIVLMVMTSAPLSGFVGLEWPDIGDWFSTKAYAEERFTEGYYTYTVENGEATITEVDERLSGDVVIPDTLGGYPVVCMGQRGLFGNCDSLLSVTLPRTLRRVVNRAFGFSKSLSSITIRSHFDVEYQTFMDSNNLKDIIFDCEEVPDDILYECYSVVNITLGSKAWLQQDTFVTPSCFSLENIYVDKKNPYYTSADGILYSKDMTRLIRYPINKSNGFFSIPDGVTEISAYAFSECRNIVDITMPNSVSKISEGAFAFCFNLKSIAISRNVSTIEEAVFTHCLNLEKITIPEGVTNILEQAFLMCASLRQVSIPTSCILIGEGAFSYTAIEKITIPNGVKYLHTPFAVCPLLVEIEIPKSVENMAEIAHECSALKKIIVHSKSENIYFSGEGYSTQYNFSGDEILRIFKEHFICNTLGDYLYTFGDITKDEYMAWATKVDSDMDNLMSYDDTQKKNDNFTICAPTGSNAEKYARDNGFIFESLDEEDNSSLTITDSPIIIPSGDNSERAVTAVYKNQSGSSVLDADIKWTVSDSSVLEVTKIQNGYNSTLTFKPKKDGAAKLTAHYNGKTASCIILVGGMSPQLNVEAGEVKQDGNQYKFDVTVGNLLSVDTSAFSQQQIQASTAKGVNIEMKLPEGFSFSQTKDERELTAVILNSSSLAPGQSSTQGFTVYKTGKASLNKVSVTAKASNASDCKMTVKLLSDGKDLTDEDRAAIKNEMRVSFVTDDNYRKIQQRAGKLEYGSYMANNSLNSNEVPVRITVSNAIPTQYLEFEEYIKSDSDFNCQIKNIEVSPTAGFKSVTVDSSANGKILKAGESITVYGTAVIDSSYLPMPDTEKQRTLSARTVVSFSNRDSVADGLSINVNNLSYSGQPTRGDSTDAGKLLKKIPNGECSVLCLTELGLSIKQCEYLSKLILTELAVFSLPPKSLEEKISDKILNKLFGYKEILSAGTGTFVITIPLQTKDGKIEIDLINSVFGASWNGTGIGNTDTISYEAYKIEKGFMGKEKRAKEPFKSGVAGMAAIANVKQFFDAVCDYALDTVKSATKSVLGDVESVERLLFGECATNIISAAGYDSFFDLGWSIYVNEVKKISINCPVDVYVYNADGALCGTIINNVPTVMCDDVKLETVNDTKIVTLYDSGYYVKTVATCNGTLNISVSELDYNNGARRVVNYDNLPLIVGSEYQQNYGSGYNVDVSTYDIIFEDGSKQIADNESLLLVDNFCSHENTYVVGNVSPSCTSSGKTGAKYCKDCNRLLSASQTVAPLGHKYSTAWTVDKAATCTSEGSKSHHCTRCDAKTDVTAISKIAHKYDAGKITKDVTCTAAGTKTYTCTVCKATKAEQIKALGHSYSTAWTTDKAATCTAQGSKSHHCTRCGAKKDVTAIPMVAHKNKVTLTKATTSKDGKQVTTCSVCKKTLKTVAIPKASSFKLSVTSYVYDGKVKIPSVTVKDSKGKVLKNGTDYTLSYSNKSAKAIGKYTVKITLKGNYSGSKTLTYYIKPGVTSKLSVKQTTTSAALTWKKVNGATGYRVMVYNSKTKKWDKVADTTKLTYTVKKLKAGTAYKYAVKAYYQKGSTLIWADKQKELSTATKPVTPTLTVKAGAKKATLNWKKLTGTGYEIFMATSKNGKYKKLATVKNAKTVSYTAKNLKKGQTVYFKIRAYKTVGKTNVYSAYSAVKAVKVK